MVDGLCRALLRDATEAEDAAQQVFLSAHRSLLNGAEPREPAAWLATIARNECWARISGRMREPLATDGAEDVAGTHDPVAEALRRADLAAFWRAIRALPKPQRDALLLREFGGLRYDELAAALAVTESAVESLLFRARTRLREQLQAAYASLAPLVRLLVSGGAPAVVTKAVALGLGAAAVTGTAVVVPNALEHRAPQLHTQTTRRARPTTPVAAAVTPAPVVHRVFRQASRPAVVHELERHDGGAQHETEHRQEHAAATTTAEQGGRDGGDGDATTATTATTTTETGPTTTTTTTSTVEPAPVTTVELSGDGGHDGGGGGSSGSDG